MTYDKIKYSVYTWKHPLILHWIINPGLAFNEIFLGQKIPKIYLIEKNSSKPLAEKTWIPCPHCGTMHIGTKWSPQNKTAFRNWFGLYCDNCGDIIPCITNLTSYLLLGISYPFWFWYKDKWKTNWLAQQKEKFSKPISNVQQKVNWMKQGIYFGLSMYLFMTFVFPFIMGDNISLSMILIGIPIWLIAGLGWGYTMKLIVGGKKKKEDKTKIQK